MMMIGSGCFHETGFFLSGNCCAWVCPDMKPVVGGSSPRLRIEVTDLNNRARAMIGTQMYTTASSEVKPGRILKLREYVVNVVSNKRYIQSAEMNSCIPVVVTFSVHVLCMLVVSYGRHH